MAKDPVEQAQRAMWAILERYKDKSGEVGFLHISVAVCWKPRAAGELPDHIDPKSIFVYDDLQKFDAASEACFPRTQYPNPSATAFLIAKVLSPSFKSPISLVAGLW